MFSRRVGVVRVSRSPSEAQYRWLLPAYLTAGMLVATPAAAFDPFEIQVYDGATSDPGAASLELHVNYHHAPKQVDEPPQMAWHKQTHFTLEPALGITRYWELGAYLQFAARADDTLYWAGAKLRTKFVTPEGWHPHLMLGLNIEVDFIPERFDPDQFAGEVRPILGWEDSYFHVAINPNIEVGLAGKGLENGPELSPALAAYFKIPDVVKFGVEYYGSLGPMAHLLPLSAQEHYLFVAGNVLSLAGWELNWGVGAGLTPASTDVIVKAIFGHELGRLWGQTTGPVPQARTRAPCAGTFL